ncbi:MAG: hypothetical protein NZ920_01340 [Aigarchaeota archaeon]|nr:hypothetical protein [Aigarchaeota archaeon]MDW8093086.1 hypothetical protein [Nitrososphaerota archaeon]
MTLSDDEKINYLKLPLSFYEPNRKLASIGVTVKNVPGALASVLDMMGRRRLNVLGLMSSGVGALEELASNSIIVDYTDAGESGLKSVVDELRDNWLVTDVKLYQSEIPGYVINEYHQAYSFLFTRAIIVVDVTLLGILERLYGMLGKEAMAAIFYHVGLSAGKFVAGKHRFLMEDVEDCIKMFAKHIKALGYATSTSMVKTTQGYELTLESLIECTLVGKLVKGHTSNYFRGSFSGYLKELTGKEYECKEVKCINAGDKWCVLSARRV